MNDPGVSAGRMVTALACDRSVRVLVAVLHGPAQEMCRRHGLGPWESRLAAEGLVAAALLGSQLKGREQLAVNVFGERPRFSINIDVRDEGSVRGRLQAPDGAAADDAVVSQRFDGLIAAIKHLDDEELYRGVADLKDGTIEDALQGFFDRSVQVDGRVRVLVEVDVDGRVSYAGGMLAERLPDMEDEDFRALIVGPMEEDFRDLMTAFAFGKLGGGEVEVLEAQEVVFRCNCSRTRVLSMLRSMGPDELRSMLDEDGGAEVTCHFCNELYEVTGEELSALIEELAGGPVG